jgi:hypothetical protein
MSFATLILPSHLFDWPLCNAKRSCHAKAPLYSMFGKYSRKTNWWRSVLTAYSIQVRSGSYLFIYGLGVFVLNSSDSKSLDYALSRFFVKLFKILNIGITGPTEIQLLFTLFYTVCSNCNWDKWTGCQFWRSVVNLIISYLFIYLFCLYIVYCVVLCTTMFWWSKVIHN